MKSKIHKKKKKKRNDEYYYNWKKHFLIIVIYPRKEKEYPFSKRYKKEIYFKKISKIILYSTFSIKKNNHIRYF